ncbi:MAG: hypothetical protein AAGI23_11725 [Bacteroidota bacterium]
MSDEIKNSGKKGRAFMWALVYIATFIIFLIWLYNYNFRYLPEG